MDKKYIISKLNSIFDGIYYNDKKKSEVLYDINQLMTYIDVTVR